MTGTDHPPSTNGPARSTSAHRALWSSLAAVAVVVGPISIASAAHGPETAGAAEPPATIAVLANIETVAEAVAPPTTAAPATTVPPTTSTTTTTTAPPPPPPPPAAVAPVTTGSGYNDPNNPAAWDRLAHCESGGNWAANTGNGYYGGIQFSLASWRGVGGTGYPHQASRETQIAMGQRLWHQGGWSQWPACASKLGYR